MIAAVLAMGLTGGRARCCTTPSLRLARAPSTRLALREGLDEAAVWQARAICTLCLRGKRLHPSPWHHLHIARDVAHAVHMPHPRSVHDILTSAETAMCVPCVWQWDVDELDSLVREIEAGEATLPARRLLAIALARKGDMPGAETQARAVLRTRVRTYYGSTSCVRALLTLASHVR